MTLKTRRPTGKPPWPLALVAGAEKAGKSWSIAEASGSPMIHRTFWISTGEIEPDEYGAVPGADFEIVEHDGTYRDMLRAIEDAAAEPAVDGKANLLALDSGTVLWELLSDMAQDTANKRASRKQGGRAVHEADISTDLWNLATQRWRHTLAALRRHRGPVVITARLEVITAFENGQPTKQKTTKVKAQKSLPFDVDVIIELPERGEAWMTGVRSVSKPMTEPRMKLQDFSLPKLWQYLGITADVVGNRVHADAVVEDAEETAEARRSEVLALCQEHGIDPKAVGAQYWTTNGHSLNEATDPKLIEDLLDSLRLEVAEREKATE